MLQWLVNCFLKASEDSKAFQVASQASEPASQPARPWTDGQMEGRKEKFPIQQDIVPYQGCCPATAQPQLKYSMKQSKSTADHMMPLGNWFSFSFSFLGSGPQKKNKVL